MNKRSKEEYFEKLKENIARDGFATVTVIDKNENKRFTYSVALHRIFKHPEIIIFGLPGNISHAIIGDIAKRAKEMTPFDLAAASTELFDDGSEVVFLKVSKKVASEYLLSAFWLNNDEDFETFQLVWKSKRDSAYPWDKEASSEFIGIQPIIAEIN
jgi:hypothetical protein